VVVAIGRPKSHEEGMHMLSIEVISALLPGTKNRKLYDAKGLYILVTPTGGKLWRLKYYFPQRTPNNKEKLLALGSYPEVSLEHARQRRDTARRDLANGIDPSLRRTCKKKSVKATHSAPWLGSSSESYAPRVSTSRVRPRSFRI
jgi:hypothetical protein